MLSGILGRRFPGGLVVTGCGRLCALGWVFLVSGGLLVFADVFPCSARVMGEQRVWCDRIGIDMGEYLNVGCCFSRVLLFFDCL